MNDSRIAKLPQWVQDHIKTIEQQRDVAVRALNKHIDSQEPTEFYHDANECTGERVGPSSYRHYIKAHVLCCKTKDVEVRFMIRDGVIEASASALKEDGDYDSRDDVGVMPWTRGCVRFERIRK